MKPPLHDHAAPRLTRRRLIGLAIASLSAAARAAGLPRIPLAEAARRLAGGGFVLMMRHAVTEPGTGDPAGFTLDDCASQRNLSEAGRSQATAIGAALRSAGIRIDSVRASAWCRCRDTAELAFGRYEVWPALNSFFEDRPAGVARTREVARFASALQAPANAMLVTHQVNITELSGAWAAPGEIVVVRWDGTRPRAEFRFGVD